MSELISYTNVVLRYVHDIATGEFVNVGVALHAPGVGYANAICQPKSSRAKKIFPGLSSDHFRSQMNHIQARFEELGQRLGSQLALDTPATVLDMAKRILPQDDSSLQWSTVGTGRCSDPAETLEKLYERMVMRYDVASVPSERRPDSEVWRHFKKSLESRRILQHFGPGNIAGKDDELECEYTWKNGVLHCLEPVSFDLSSPEKIRQKARGWLGRVTSISDAPEKFRLYFLVGQPQDIALRPAYESAINILKKAEADLRIFAEADADAFSALIEQEVVAHEQRSH